MIFSVADQTFSSQARGEVAVRIAYESGFIPLPVGERGIVAHLSTFDEEEGVILAKGIVHESLPRHRGFHYRTVLIALWQSCGDIKCSLAFDPIVTNFRHAQRRV